MALAILARYTHCASNPHAALLDMPLPAGHAPLPSNDGKKWSQEEVTELLLLVEDEGYRRQRLGLDKVRGCAMGTL